MKTLLFSKLTLVVGLSLVCALSAQHLRLNSILAIPHSMAAPQPDQPPVNDPNQPQVFEVRQDEQSDISITTAQVHRGIKQFARQSLDVVNDWVGLAIAHVTGPGTTLTLSAPPSSEESDHHAQGNTNDRHQPKGKDLQVQGNTNDRQPPEERDPGLGGNKNEEVQLLVARR